MKQYVKLPTHTNSTVNHHCCLIMSSSSWNFWIDQYLHIICSLFQYVHWYFFWINQYLQSTIWIIVSFEQVFPAWPFSGDLYSPYLAKTLRAALTTSMNWLVVTNPRKMMDFVSWDDHSQYINIYIWKNKIQVPNHQSVYIYIHIYLYIYIYIYMENIDYSHCMEKQKKFQSTNQWRFIGMIHEPPPSSECTRWYSYMIYVFTVLK
jgi:hypothetical protein